MRKKKGTMATAAAPAAVSSGSSKSHHPPHHLGHHGSAAGSGSGPAEISSPIKKVMSGAMSPKQGPKSMRSITPSPVLIHKSADGRAVPAGGGAGSLVSSPPPGSSSHLKQNGTTVKDGPVSHHSAVPNGKLRQDTNGSPDNKVQQPPPTPPVVRVTSMDGPYPSVSSPRSARSAGGETAGPSGLSRSFLNDSGRGGGGGGGVDRPSSVASSTTSMASTASPEAGGSKPGASGGKVTVGEIVQQIEVKSAALLRREDFTRADVWPELSFLAQQSRYNSDMHVKRKLYMKMVDNGLLNIFLKVFRSIHSVDFLQMLAVAQAQHPLSVDDTDSVAGDSASLCGGEINGSKEKDSISFIDDKDDDDRSIGGGPLDDSSSSARDRRGRAAADRYRNMPDFMKNFRAAITLLWNVSEKSPALCEDCIKRGMIQLLLTDLTDPRLGVNDLKDPNKLHIVKGYLGILSNLVRFHSDARDIFRDSGAVKILQHYLKSSLLVIKSKTVMLLSYIINESENDIINSSDKHIAFFVKVLQTAMESDNHYAKKYGYWAVEVVAGLNRLAAFESNKERIVQKGVVTIYTRLLAATCSDEEQILACQGLWVFAFSTSNRQAITAEPGCVKALENLELNGSREETKRTAKGALWVIQQRTSSYGKDPVAKDHGRDVKDHGRDTKDYGRDAVRELSKESSKDPPGSPLPGGGARKGSVSSETSVSAGPYQPHVMVSYQWSTRLVMSKVRDRLRAAGYKVWMDTDNIALPSLEAMSLAVERAAVLLVCLSQKYKDSPVCRTEAEYALRLRKDVVPLKLQPRYNPDGWLGRLVGNKLAFDFTSEDNIDNMMPNLVRELNVRGRVRAATLSECSSMEAMRYLSPSMTSLNSTVPMEMYNHKGMRLVAAPSLSSINTAIHVDATMRISSWNIEDVAKWLADNELSQLSDKFSHVNGELLIEIRKMQQRAPETFYNTIKNELKLDFLSTLKFTRALDKLT